MKNRKQLLAIVLCISLMLSLVAVFQVFVTANDDLSDNLLIHYDFEGDDWATVLSDKAGTVKTNLTVLDGKAATVADGAITNALTDSAAIDAIFAKENGVLSAVGTDKTNVIAGGFTTDSAAIHVKDTPTELTLYMRVKVTAWSGWNTIFSMRTTGSASAYTTANNRVFNMEFDSETNVNMYAGGNSVKTSATALDPNGDGWVDVAVVRTPAAAADGFDTLTLYAMGETAWGKIGSTNYNLAHNTMDASTLLFGLFGGANGSNEGGKTNVQYDDIRVYDKSLTLGQVTAVYNEVTGSTLEIPTEEETTTAAPGGSDAPAGDPEYAEKLLIHYDFEGDNWAEILADKAGDVKTNLTVLNGTAATVENGAISNAVGSDTNIDQVFKAENGVMSAKTAAKTNVVAAGFTSDTAAIHDPAVLSGLTVYMRVKVNTWFGWNSLVSMRTTGSDNTWNAGANNRVFHSDIDGANLQIALGNNAAAQIVVTNAKAALDADNDGWIEIAAVRTPATAVTGKNSFSLYGLTANGWEQLGETKEQSFAHNTMDSSKLLLGLFGGANGSNEGGATNVAYDDVRIYGATLDASQLAEVHNEVMGLAANTIFVEAEDCIIDDTTVMKVVDDDKAIGGKRVECVATATDAAGKGLTLKFTVPADGTYTIWGRLYAPNNQANSMHYNVDGANAKVWDMVDEDLPTNPAYNSWHYMYLTSRQTAVYDANGANGGTFTQSANEWRHAPNTLTLTAGEHTIHITGREAGWSVDQFVITPASIEEYNPNACTGNESLLDVCKFCNVSVNPHYTADIFALYGVTAEQYLNDPTIKLTPLAPEGGEGEGEGEGNNGGNNNEENVTTATPEKETNAPETDAATEAVTDAPAEEKTGCSGMMTVGALALIAIPAAAVCVLKKKED